MRGTDIGKDLALFVSSMNVDIPDTFKQVSSQLSMIYKTSFPWEIKPGPKE